jgi:hypothetical protein
LYSRKAVLEEFQEYGLTVPQIVDRYWKWVSEVKYMILNRVELKEFRIRDSLKNKMITVKFPVESEYFALKCSKRGNDVYRSRVYRRFKDLAEQVEKTVFFNPKDRALNKRTRALFVTLTYDTKLCGIAEAWLTLGYEYNRFTAYIRKKFGKVSCFRVFEAYDNGYPHIHCILLFEEKEFKVFRDKKGQFRIKEKGVIAEGWRSHTDVKAMGSLGRGLSYLKKYLLKSIDKESKDSKALKTLALGWLFNKRAFSVSGKFRQTLVDLIKTKHNSNHKTQQITLEGKIIQEFTYYLLGFVPADVVRLKKDVWFSKINNEQIKSVEKYLESKKLSRVKF